MLSWIVLFVQQSSSHWFRFMQRAISIKPHRHTQNRVALYIGNKVFEAHVVYAWFGDRAQGHFTMHLHVHAECASTHK